MISLFVGFQAFWDASFIFYLLKSFDDNWIQHSYEPLTQALRRLRQKDLCEFETRLICTVSSWTARTIYIVNLCLENNKIK